MGEERRQTDKIKSSATLADQHVSNNTFWLMVCSESKDRRQNKVLTRAFANIRNSNCIGFNAIESLVGSRSSL